MRHHDGALPAADHDRRHEGALIAATVRSVGSARFRVYVLRIGWEDHFCIERNGKLVAEHVGSLYGGWPGDEFPPEVHEAVASIVNQLSWD